MGHDTWFTSGTTCFNWAYLEIEWEKLNETPGRADTEGDELMWKPENVQLSKEWELIVASKQEFCDIANFTEPDDIVNIAGSWRVEYQTMKAKGKPSTRSRPFKSKTWAQNFIDFLKTTSAVITNSKK